MKKKINYFHIILLLLFLLQFFIIIYFNLFQLKNHIGYDSSWSYLKATLIFKEKSFNSNIWCDQTSVFLDSSLPLASIFYGFTNDIFLSYGLANIIVLLCIIACLNSIFKLLNFSLTNILIGLNLLICPYLTNGFRIQNDLGYFSNLLCGPTFYALRTLIFLAIIREFLYLQNSNKISINGILSLFLCILAGSSSGIFLIIIILVPFILYLCEQAFISNRLTIFTKIYSIYSYLCIILVFLGKLLGNFLFQNIETIDSSRTWTSIINIWKNIGSVIQGFMKLLGVLPVLSNEITIMSPEGISRIFTLIIFVVSIISIIYSISICIKSLNTNNILLFFCNILICHFLIFALFNVEYGSVIFEERYLINTYMVIIILICYFLNSLNLTLIFTKFVYCSLFISILCTNIVSNYNYINTTNDNLQIDEIYDLINTTDSHLIYLWGDNNNLLGRVIRTYDLSRVYKCITDDGKYFHWGDYLYYEDVGDYSGSTILIVPKNDTIVPDYIMNQYELITQFNNIDIYYCTYNPIDLVSGITGTISNDYPYSPGLVTKHGEFINTSYVTTGEISDYVLYGPYTYTKEGNYNFTLHYEMVNDDAYFEIATDLGKNILGKINLDPNKTQITISNIYLNEGDLLEYRIYCEKGTRINIKQIVMVENN